MDLLQSLFIILIGLIAGFINTVGGGGSLISLPILIFLGLPGSVANATLRVAVLTQNIFAVSGFKSKGVKLPLPYSLYLGIGSLAGGFIGATLAVQINDSVFNKILAIVMIMVVISIVVDRKKKKQFVAERLTAKHQILGVISFFILGIYGGFIQAGIGFFVILALTNINHLGLVKTNYIKVFAGIVYSTVSVIIFASENKIMWLTALTLSIGQGIGGWYASRWSVDKGEVWIKRVLAVTVIGLAIKLWFF